MQAGRTAILRIMRVAVTGGTGFIGRALIRALRERGDSVIALSRDIFRAKEILGDGIELVHWEAGGRPGPWEGELSRSDAVVNLAGEESSRSVGTPVTNPAT